MRLERPALIADGHHARADAYVSLAVVESAAVVALGLPVADPLLGLGITAVILRITWQSWVTVRRPPPPTGTPGSRAPSRSESDTTRAALRCRRPGSP